MRHLPPVSSVSRSQRCAGQAKATPSRRGRLVGAETRDTQNWDIAAISTEGGSEPKPVLKDSYLETQPMISPDRKYIAYTSDKTGKN